MAVQAATVGRTLPSHLDVPPISRVELEKGVDRAAVELITLGCDLSLGQGTGVALAADRVLTNRHVADRFRSLNVVAIGRGPTSQQRSDVQVSAAADVA